VTAYVEKIRVPVRVSYGGMPPIEGDLALGPQAQFHAGSETLLERLNQPGRVVPFQRAEDDRTVLLNRAEIDWVAADPTVSSSLVCPPTYNVTHQESVDLRLLGGGSLEGQVQIELPEHLNRASDFINGPEDFFPLLTPFGVLLVNKARVSSYELHSASPGPPFEDVETARRSGAA
jgi:hypothetical protein